MRRKMQGGREGTIGNHVASRGSSCNSSGTALAKALSACFVNADALSNTCTRFTHRCSVVAAKTSIGQKTKQQHRHTGTRPAHARFKTGTANIPRSEMGTASAGGMLRPPSDQLVPLSGHSSPGEASKRWCGTSCSILHCAGTCCYDVLFYGFT